MALELDLVYLTLCELHAIPLRCKTVPQGGQSTCYQLFKNEE